MKYISFGKTLDEILHFDHTLKLTTVDISWWSSYTKQWHMLWILKSYFKYVTHIYCIYQDVGQALPNVIKPLIWESVITSAMLRILLSWQFLFQSQRIFGAMWSLILYQDYLLRHPKGKIGLWMQGKMKQGALSGCLRWHWMWLLWHLTSPRTVRHR